MLSRGLSRRSWYCPPSRSDRTRSASKYFQALVWPHMPSGPTGPKHAVVNLLGIAVLKTQDVDQPHEAKPESVAIRISVRVFRALAVLLRFTNGLSGTTSLKDDNALLTKRQGPTALANSVLEQQVRCVSHDRVCLTLYGCTAPIAGSFHEGHRPAPRLVHRYVAILLGGRPAVNSFESARLYDLVDSDPTNWFRRHKHARPWIGGRRQSLLSRHLA